MVSSKRARKQTTRDKGDDEPPLFFANIIMKPTPHPAPWADGSWLPSKPMKPAKLIRIRKTMEPRK